MNPMKEKLDDKLYIDWYNQQVKLEEQENKIKQRLDYIVKSVFEVFGENLLSWEFSFNDSLFDSSHSNYIEIFSFAKCKYGGEMYGLNVLLNNEVVSLSSNIPIRWLSEDFEYELIQGKKLYLEAVEKEKQAKEQEALDKQQKRATLIAQAKAKLTQEEFDAINPFKSMIK